MNIFLPVGNKYSFKWIDYYGRKIGTIHLVSFFT